MDNTTLIVLVCINIATSILTTFAQTATIFMKLIKKSTCCGSSLEMKNTSLEKMTLSPTDTKPSTDKTFDLIIDRLEKRSSGYNTAKK